MRPATAADLDAVTETITLAFVDDPVWGAALERADGSTEHQIAYWRTFAEGGIPLGMVFLADDAAAVALWIPPGEDEMTERQVEDLTAHVHASLDPAGAAAMFALWDRFDTTHPRTEPHAYLSILATHPDHRGQGIAQALLRDNLAEFDRQGLPTYLESSNPANDHRYARLGYSPVGVFEGVRPGAIVTQMWRPVPGRARTG